MRNFPIIAGCVLLATTASAAPAPVFRAGAAKVDVTPGPQAMPRDYLGVLDHVYARSIVVDDGVQHAALVSLDAGVISEPLYNAVVAGISARLHIPAVNILLTATHSHSVPRDMPVADLAAKIVASVALADSRLQPARMGYGTGLSWLNVNRNIIDPKTHRWWEGPNYDGVSDKTVAAIKFETLSGEPIAVYYNYAMHGVVVGQLDLVSGDAPGAASRYIEDNFDDKVVALWSTGAEGDQNPIYFQQTYDLREIRVKDFAKRGQDISNAMPPGGQGLDRSNRQVIKLMNQQKQMILSQGQFLGEEVLRIMRDTPATVPTAPIHAAQTITSCPGRERTDAGRAGYPGTYKDAPPIDLRLSMMMIGDVAIGGVDGEVFTTIGQRFKKESPYAHTMMATLTNGLARSGYIPNDAAFGYNTFEVVSSSLKPGCAETAIVDGLLGMMPPIQR
jgi:hypothetical protein